MELIERLFTASSISERIAFLAFTAATFTVYIVVLRVITKAAANVFKNIF